MLGHALKIMSDVFRDGKTAHEIAARQGVDPLIKSSAVREELSRQGDTGIRPRKITHYLFADAEGGAPLDDVKNLAKGFGLSVRRTGPFHAEAEHTHEIASGAFSALISEVSNKLAPLGWNYDGWSSVVTPDEET